MKGLIYHELTLAKKRILLIFAIFAGLLVIHIMFLLSYKFGNLSHGLTEEQMEVKNAFENLYYAELIVLLMAAIGFADNIMSHAKTGWFNLAFTFPDKIRGSVTATYICVVATEIIGFSIGCVVAMGTSFISGKAISGDSWRLLVFILLGMIVAMAIVLPLSFWLRDENKVTAAIFIPVFIGISIIFYRWTRMENEEILLELAGIKDKFMGFMAGKIPVMIVATIIIVTISCMTSISIMQRREVI